MTKDVIKQVRKIEITTKHLVDGLITGNYHSVFKGEGIEFSDIREYRPGDDIRAIDWKVTARFNRPFIKEFIEERDLRIYFVFDYSASNSFGNITKKRKKAIEITATLMFSAMRNNDNVGLLIFTSEIEKFIPAKKGKRHVLKLITTMVTYDPAHKGTDLNKALAYLSNIVKKRSIIFIVSDFYGQEFVKPLVALKKRHDVIAIRVNDLRETNIPNIGLIELEDEETGEQVLVDTSNEEFRKNYSELMNKENKRIETVFMKRKVDTVTITTDEPYEVPLRKFFKKRCR